MANPTRVFERGVDGVTFEKAIPAPQTGDTFPAGALIDYVGGDVPAGWLVCNGDSVSRATYPALFAAIGTTYGAGAGDGLTFNVPDVRGKVTVGKHSAGTFTALGQVGGAETVAPDVAAMPSHDHGAGAGSAAPGGFTDTHGGHTHAGDRVCGVNANSGSVTNMRAGSANWIVMQTPNFLTDGAHSHAIAVDSHAHAINAEGSGTAHNNIQPYITLGKLIRAY